MQKIDFAEAAELLEEGLSLQAIGNVYGASKQAVRQGLKRHGYI